jgi:hypothetical protein
MNPNAMRNARTTTMKTPVTNTMENTKINTTRNTTAPMATMKVARMATGSALLLALLLAGCGPTFDPASLINTTRVVGASVQVDGAPDRAMPKPGETATVTWLVTAPGATPPLAWAFALCAPGTAGGNNSLGCQDVPVGLFQGTQSPPRISIAIPAADVLGAAKSLLLYGVICAGAGSMPTFDPESGIPRCTGGGASTTASVSIALQRGDETNHNPLADRAFTFDGQPWAPMAAGSDPCVVGPRVSAGSKEHVIGNTTEGTDREPYTAMLGDPTVATPVRESLQISQFTTTGELKSQFSFVEGADSNAQTTVDVKWNAPKAADVPAAGLPVTFTFVVRDNRGGIDWTTRAACVGP